MKGRRDLLIGVTFLVVFVSLAIGERILETRVVAEAAGVQAPMFEVDPLWPKPLPNHWVMGNTIGVSADAQDHIWIIHRAGSLEAKEVYATKNPPQASCCLPAPASPRIRPGREPIAPLGRLRREKATNGRIPITASRSTTKVMSGSAETAWHRSECAAPRRRPGSASRTGADGGSARRRTNGPVIGYSHDSMIMKFTQDGKFLMQIGKVGASKGSNDVENLRLPAKIFVDKDTNEVYVADGYGNHRVIVYRRRHRQIQAALGRLRQQARRHQSRSLQSGCAAGPTIPKSCSLRRAVQGRSGLRLRSRERSHSGLQERRYVREGSVSSRSARWATGRSGTLLSRKIRSRSTSTSSTARTRRSTSCCATRWKS